MATTSFTLVGNSADSRGLADVTPCIATPNEEAQQRRPPVRQDTPKNSDAAAVCCSGWFGGGRHGWRRTLLQRLAAVDDHGVADHEGGGV
jgi:hypothetical protein